LSHIMLLQFPMYVSIFLKNKFWISHSHSPLSLQWLVIWTSLFLFVPYGSSSFPPNLHICSCLLVLQMFDLPTPMHNGKGKELKKSRFLFFSVNIHLDSLINTHMSNIYCNNIVKCLISKQKRYLAFQTLSLLFPLSCTFSSNSTTIVSHKIYNCQKTIKNTKTRN
jgi:hypothetical protein